MSSNSGTIIYEHQHSVSVLFDAIPAATRIVLIKMLKFYNNKLVIKVQELDNYNFNYTGEINHEIFTKMKAEQSLEIDFSELHSQIVDLFKDTLQQNMFLRLEANHTNCKLIFYEKSRLKSLIFLTIDLQVTNQAEIIEEMAKNLEKYKEINNTLNYQLNNTKARLTDSQNSLKSSNLEKLKLEAHCREQLTLVANKFTTSFNSVEGRIVDKLSQLGRRHVKLQNDMAILKNENRLKCESNVRLLSTLQSLRLENERNAKLIDDFRMEVDHLRLVKGNAEEEIAATRRQLHGKQTQCDEQQRNIDILKRDLQEATLIIAQKTKMHDEIAKDLVQANSMLVNFNNQYDDLAKEYETLKETLENREKVIQSLQQEVKGQESDLQAYKAEYGPERVQVLQNEIFLAQKTHQEMDKQYKEAIKLNALLTRKLSSTSVRTAGDRSQSQTQEYINNLPPPSQRSNY